MNKTKVFWNVVIDEDLFYMIYDYVSFNEEPKKKFNIYTLGAFDEMDIETWKNLAKDAINWLENNQLTKIYVLDKTNNAPSKDTWGTLYYQTLAYMDSVFPKYYDKFISSMNYDELISVCTECINNFKELVEQIHEPNDNDLDNI